MNAEDCPVHRKFIDVPGSCGIYYPWICECPYPDCIDDPGCGYEEPHRHGFACDDGCFTCAMNGDGI